MHARIVPIVADYEKKSLVPAACRGDSGYRDYSDADAHRLRFIANARDLCFPIEGIGDLVFLWSHRERSSVEVKSAALTRAEQLGDKARKLEAMRAALLDLAGQSRGDDRPACPIFDQLAAR